MSPLAQTFLSLAAKHLPKVQFNHDPGPPFAFVIPAKHPEVGDLRIYDDEEELTISFDKLTHCHYSINHYGDIADVSAIRETALAAVDYVSEVLTDNRIVRVRYHDGAWKGSTDSPRDGYIPSPLQPGEKDFVWSGPL